MARTTVRAQRRPLATLVGGLVVVAGAWLAGGLAAAAGWSPALRWLAAALVWPIVPVALLILISPRLGLRRVSLGLVLLGAGACALWWRSGLVEAVTTHAAWMLPAASEGDMVLASPEPAPTPKPEPAREPSKSVEASKPVEPIARDPSLPHAPRPPVSPSEASRARDESKVPASRCFREHVKSEHSDHTYGTTLVDMDGDGIQDAVAIESGSSSAIRVWKGDRAGRFHAASTLAYDGGGLQFAALDLDRDGKLDLATSDFEKATVTLWMGAGDGSVTRGASQKTYRSPIGVWAADLEADGFTDLIVAHYFHIEVMRGGKGGKLRADPWLRLVKEAGGPGRLLTPEDIAAVDLTGDGLLDLVIPKGDVSSIEVWTGRRRGGLRRAAEVASCYAPSYTLVGDVIEDGSPDVVVRCGEGHVELFAGNGKGGLEARGRIGPEKVLHAGALVDLTGDGHLDLITTTIPAGLLPPDSKQAGVLAVHAGDGKGGFGERDVLALGDCQHRIVAVVDIDGDEHLDVVHECFGQSPGGHLGALFGTGCASRP